jgi:hypothetical protein
LNLIEEITSVQPNTGSVLGSTFLTIYGKYFYSDANLPADIRIGGKEKRALKKSKLTMFKS